MDTSPTWNSSPSSHTPDRSTSGSIAEPSPTVSRPVTGANACMSTPLPIFAPNMRAVIFAALALEMFSAPEATSQRSAAHSRTCCAPPRLYTPGFTRPRISRAPSAPIGMRPNGVHSTKNAAASQDQLRSVRPSRFAAMATQVTAVAAFNVITGTINAVCATRVPAPTGATSRSRLAVRLASVSSSISEASVSSLGWS